MSIRLKAKTGDAYQIKVLAEFLSNNLKTGCFELSEKGLVLRQIDSHRKTLIDLFLNGEEFNHFKYNKDKQMNMGLNLNHLYKLVKNIKKKDSLQLVIEEENPTDLLIKTIAKENTRIGTSTIKIQHIQTLDIEIPTGYGKPVVVNSSEFQKTIKDLIGINGPIIRVESKKSYICFRCDAEGGIIKRHVDFGERDDDDDDDSPEYSEEFTTEQFSKIIKIAGLSNTIQIYPAQDLPLFFCSKIGTIGTISVYIKPQEFDEVAK